MPNDTNPWFPAKEYGWGWGPPNTWQGWITVALWSFILGGGFGVLLNMGPIGAALCVIHVMLMVAVLVAVCYVKGETLRYGSGPPKTSGKRKASVGLLFTLVLIGTLGLGLWVGGTVAFRLLQEAPVR